MSPIASLAQRLLPIGSLALLASGLCLPAQENTAPAATAEETPAATTTSDVNIKLGILRVRLRPTPKADFETELNAWLKLLESKISEVVEVNIQLNALESAETPPENAEQQIAALGDQLRQLRTE